MLEDCDQPNILLPKGNAGTSEWEVDNPTAQFRVWRIQPWFEVRLSGRNHRVSAPRYAYVRGERKTLLRFAVWLLIKCLREFPQDELTETDRLNVLSTIANVIKEKTHE